MNPGGWYCFTCDSTPKEQLWLASRLRRNGYQVINPTEEVYRAPNKFEEVKGHKRTRELCLLPGYIFCRMFETAVGSFLESDKRIYQVLEMDGRPAVIPDNVVELFVERFKDKYAPSHYRYQRTHHEFNVEDLCEFIAGPLAGQQVEILEINNDLVKVPVTMLGKQSIQEVSAWSLKKVG